MSLIKPNFKDCYKTHSQRESQYFDPYKSTKSTRNLPYRPSTSDFSYKKSDIVRSTMLMHRKWSETPEINILSSKEGRKLNLAKNIYSPRFSLSTKLRKTDKVERNLKYTYTPLTKEKRDNLVFKLRVF